MYCTKCGKEATQGDSFCASCGAALAPTQVDLASRRQHETVVPYMLTQLKSEGTSVVLAFVLGFFGILGTGHMYVGRLEKGLGLFLTGVVCYGLAIAGLMLYFGSSEEGYWDDITYDSGWLILTGIFGFLYFILWISLVFDATEACREYNSQLLEPNQNPEAKKVPSNIKTRSGFGEPTRACDECKLEAMRYYYHPWADGSHSYLCSNCLKKAKQVLS